MQGSDDRGRILRRSRDTLQIIEPLSLFARAAGNELRGEYLTECRIVPSPPKADELDQGFRLLTLLRRSRAAQHSASVGAQQDKMGDPFRMPRRIGDCDRASLRHP